MARNRLTLLEAVQRVLSAMNHDLVNSISDTAESTQIAEEARHVYYDLMDRDDWPHLVHLRELEALGDTTRPNYLKIPEEVVRIDDVRYNVTQTTDTNTVYKQIEYLEPTDFLSWTQTRNTSNSNVVSITDFNSVEIFVIDDDPPQCWTTFDDEHIVFDAYDSAVDTTLQASKTQVLVKEIPVWTASDTFVPDMPDQMFSVFIAELTAVCFTYFKQGTSIKDEQRAIRGISRLRKDARKHNERRPRANFGRKRPRIVQSLNGTRGSIRAAL